MIRNLALLRTLVVMRMLRDRRCTLEVLASSVGVSTRTIRRDIEVLKAAHVPVHWVVDEDVAEIRYWWIDRDFRL